MDHIDKLIAQWHRERPDLDVSAMALLGRLTRLSVLLRSQIETTLNEKGLTPAAFDVLATLRRSGAPYSLTAGALMSATLVSSGTVTHRIDRLVAQGLVLRDTDPQDKRVVSIALTQAGKDVIDKVIEAHVATQQRLVAPLPPAQRAALDALLRDYLALVEPPDQNGASQAEA